jgi:hypothetical protein
MPPSSLDVQVDSWTTQILGAAGVLVRLYRCLGDDKQAAVALQILAPAEERARRLRLKAPAPLPLNERAGETETETEAAAWGDLLTAQAGLFTFHAMVVDNSPEGRKLGGARNLAGKTLQRAIRGLQTAFPEGMAQAILDQAIQSAARTCSCMFAQNIDREGEPELAGLDQTLYVQILQALQMEASLQG